jgi:hypothetical protein
MRVSPFVRLLVIVGWLFTSLSTAQNTSTPQGNADKGKQTYIKNGCYSGFTTCSSRCQFPGWYHLAIRTASPATPRA